MTILRGTLKSASRVAAKSADVALARDAALAQHDRGGDLLAELVVRHGEGDDLGDRRMIHQHVVDLERRDLLAAAVDDLLEPAGDAQIAILVEHALVAGVEPAMREGRGVGVRDCSRSPRSRSARE